MNTTVFYGVILAVTNIVLYLVGFFLGFQSEKMAQGQWFGLLSLLAAIVVLFVGIRAVREEASDKSMSFGRGVGSGMKICLWGGLITAAYSFVHYSFIHPDFADYVISFSRDQWAAAGMSESQMDGAEEVTRKFTSPVMQSVFVVIMTLISGIIISLIAAAILKRQPPPPPLQA